MEQMMGVYTDRLVRNPNIETSTDFSVSLTYLHVFDACRFRKPLNTTWDLGDPVNYGN